MVNPWMRDNLKYLFNKWLVETLVQPKISFFSVKQDTEGGWYLFEKQNKKGNLHRSSSIKSFTEVSLFLLQENTAGVMWELLWWRHSIQDVAKSWKIKMFAWLEWVQVIVKGYSCECVEVIVSGVLVSWSTFSPQQLWAGKNMGSWDLQSKSLEV